MTRIVADVGGTNCRLALCDTRGRLSAVQRFANDDHQSFAEVVEDFLTAQNNPRVREMVVAVAGPLSGQRARLTNRDWHFDSNALSQRFDLRAHLLNDLGALGHALPLLPASGLLPIFAPHPKREHTSTTQHLVVGIGTGFNVSPVLITDGQANVLGAEAGHQALPQDLYRVLETRIGTAAVEFATVEACFSGRGLEAIHAAYFPEMSPRPAKEIIAAQSTTAGLGFLNFYAELLALMCRNLRLAYLPEGGIHLAGSVARNLLTSPAKTRFIQVYAPQDPYCPQVSAPVSCIQEDSAALLGCAHLALPERQI